MKLVFQNIKHNAVFLMRRVGYGFERKNVETGEDVFARRLGSYEYPKFHVYAHKESNTLIINLHLDQKKPSYEGSQAHSGEYGGEVVEQEVERITVLMNKLIKEV